MLNGLGIFGIHQLSSEIQIAALRFRRPGRADGGDICKATLIDVEHDPAISDQLLSGLPVMSFMRQEGRF